MVKVRNNLVGQHFERLTVIEQAEDYISKKGKHSAMWKCVCSCESHNIVFVSTQNLKKGHTKSCGCYNKDLRKSRKKYNEYSFVNEYVVGKTFNGDNFYFDIEDYDVINKYCWYVDTDGYLRSHKDSTTIQMHRLIMGFPIGLVIDHIDGNKLNNRKSNLRICSIGDNDRHKITESKSKSRVYGVFFDKRIKKWGSKINYNGKNYYLGSFDKFEDAVIARRKAELKYFREFAPQKCLYSQYIKTEIDDMD